MSEDEIYLTQLIMIFLTTAILYLCLLPFLTWPFKLRRYEFLLVVYKRASKARLGRPHEFIGVTTDNRWIADLHFWLRNHPSTYFFSEGNWIQSLFWHHLKWIQYNIWFLDTKNMLLYENFNVYKNCLPWKSTFKIVALNWIWTTNITIHQIRQTWTPFNKTHQNKFKNIVNFRCSWKRRVVEHIFKNLYATIIMIIRYYN